MAEIYLRGLRLYLYQSRNSKEEEKNEGHQAQHNDKGKALASLSSLGGHLHICIFNKSLNIAQGQANMLTKIYLEHSHSYGLI